MALPNDLILLQMLQDEINRLEMNRAKKALRDGSNPLEMPEGIFRGIYRISRETANWLIGEIAPYMAQPERDEIFIPNAIRICTTLEFLAHGNYQKSVGQDFQTPMSQSSVSRSIIEVCMVITATLSHHIRFPQTVEEMTREKLTFMERERGFPGIIGCVDGTHVGIIAPPTNDAENPGIIYYNRKGFYSINVQLICNANLKILNINARYPGSVHDAAVWMNCQPKQVLQANYNQGDHTTYLLGDSGYGLEPWLMTPFRRVENAAQGRYNLAHRSLRNTVERCNGVLKERFRCLSRHRILHYGHEAAARIIYSCAILHNIFLQRNEDIIELDDNLLDNDDDDDNDPQGGANVGNAARNIRNFIVQNYFQ